MYIDVCVPIDVSGTRIRRLYRRRVYSVRRLINITHKNVGSGSNVKKPTSKTLYALKHYRMQPNHSKCAFRVGASKFLELY